MEDFRSSCVAWATGSSFGCLVPCWMSRRISCSSPANCRVLISPPVKYMPRAAEEAAAWDGIGIRDGTGVQKGTKWEERTCYQGVALGLRVSQS